MEGKEPQEQDEQYDFDTASEQSSDWGSPVKQPRLEANAGLPRHSDSRTSGATCDSDDKLAPTDESNPAPFDFGDQYGGSDDDWSVASDSPNAHVQTHHAGALPCAAAHPSEHEPGSGFFDFEDDGGIPGFKDDDGTPGDDEEETVRIRGLSDFESEEEDEEGDTQEDGEGDTPMVADPEATVPNPDGAGGTDVNTGDTRKPGDPRKPIGHMAKYRDLFLIKCKNVATESQQKCAVCGDDETFVMCRTCKPEVIYLCAECDVITHTGQVCSPNAHDRIIFGTRRRLLPKERCYVNGDAINVVPMMGQDYVYLKCIATCPECWECAWTPTGKVDVDKLTVVTVRGRFDIDRVSFKCKREGCNGYLDAQSAELYMTTVRACVCAYACVLRVSTTDPVPHACIAQIDADTYEFVRTRTHPRRSCSPTIIDALADAQSDSVVSHLWPTADDHACDGAKR